MNGKFWIFNEDFDKNVIMYKIIHYTIIVASCSILLYQNILENLFQIHGKSIIQGELLSCMLVFFISASEATFSKYAMNNIIGWLSPIALFAGLKMKALEIDQAQGFIIVWSSVLLGNILAMRMKQKQNTMFGLFLIVYVAYFIVSLFLTANTLLVIIDTLIISIIILFGLAQISIKIQRLAFRHKLYIASLKRKGINKILSGLMQLSQIRKYYIKR